MTSQDIVYRRLINQRIAGEGFEEPAGLLQWMGCIQADDLTAAKWAIGHRVTGSTDASIRQAFNEGQLLRTHVLQPVSHFVSPADIRWMLALTGPRLKVFNKEIYHALGIYPGVLKKSRRVIVRALEKEQFTRAQLKEVLQKEHIHADDLRLGWLLMDAELEGLICSGSMEGEQCSYALLDERAPLLKKQEKEEWIAELAKRYFRSRGPATIDDFAEWCGLRLPDISIGMELNKHWLTREVVDGQVYWFDGFQALIDPGDSLFLLPALDEMTAAYKGNSIFKPILLIDGRMAGTWRNVLRANTVTVDVTTPVRMDTVLQDAIRREAQRYSAFWGKRLV